MDNYISEDAFLVLVRVPGTAYYPSDNGNAEEEIVNYSFSIAVYNYPVMISSRSFVNQNEQSTYGLVWNLAKISVVPIKDDGLKQELKTHHKNGKDSIVNYYIDDDFLIPIKVNNKGYYSNKVSNNTKEVLISRIIFGADKNGKGELPVDAELIKRDLNNDIWFYSDLRS